MADMKKVYEDLTIINLYQREKIPICNFHKWWPIQGWAVLAYRLYIYFWFHELKLPKVLNDLEVPHTGVGPIGVNHDQDLIYHNYYMWVPYLLLFQSVTFFVPLLLHRFAQEGKSQLLIAGLHNVIPFHETREDKYGDAKFYFRDYWNQHNWWATKLLFCDILNLVNIIINIFLTNW